MFNKHIKRIAKFVENSALEKELNNILGQLPHKDDVVHKNNITGEFIYPGTGSFKIIYKDGQITEIKTIV